MINLIPPEGKRVVRKEYVLRVYTVAGVVLSIALFVSAAALVPTYVLFLSSPTPETSSKVTEPNSEEYARVTATLEAAMKVATQLQKPVPGLETSKIVSHIEAAVSPDITLEGMHFSQDAKQVRVEALGVARTRESLQAFIAALKKDTFFSDAQVPVSNLIKDTDLLFTLTITLRSS